MCSITLTFDKTVQTSQRPNTFEELSSLIESTFPYAQVGRATYIDDDGDSVTVSTTRDLTEAYRLCASWGRGELELHLEGTQLTQSFMTESVVQKLEMPPSEKLLSLDSLRISSVPVASMPVEQPKPVEQLKPVEQPKPVEQLKPVELPKPAEQPKPAEEPKEKPEEERLMECMKCQGRGITLKKKKLCKWCKGTGTIDANRNPKMKRLLDLVRKEVAAAIERSEILQTSKELERTQGVHLGVYCNGCGKKPLIGCRYKCSVCQDFDFCVDCEESRKHEHPFIKIRRPDQQPAAIFSVVSEDPQGCMISTRPPVAKPEKLFCKFVSDVEGRDGDSQPAGSTFRKTWRVKNPGKTWPEGCTFACVSGNFEGEAVKLPALATGMEHTISVVCVAPKTEGRYQSFWQAQDPQGVTFGDRLWIDINTVNSLASYQKQMRRYLNTDPIAFTEILRSVGGDVCRAVERMKELHR